ARRSRGGDVPPPGAGRRRDRGPAPTTPAQNRPRGGRAARAGARGAGGAAMKRAASRSWRPLLVLAVLIGIWELYVDLGGADSLLVLWLGFGILPKLVVIALVSFFSIVVTTLAGLAAVDPELPKLMRTFDATRARVFRLVELPAALPGVFTGAKISVVVAVIGAVFAEQAGSNSGLGYLFEVSLPQLLTARAYAAVAIL